MQKNYVSYDIFSHFISMPKSNLKALNLNYIFFNKLAFNFALSQDTLSTYPQTDKMYEINYITSHKHLNFVETGDENLLSTVNMEFFKTYSTTHATPNNSLQFFSIFY
jgi:hypothetical protein